MSWQSYVDQQILGGGEATGGIITGHDGAIWAHSPEFTGKVSTEEILKIIKTYDDPSTAFTNGIYFGGERWRCVRVDKDMGWIHLKKDSSSAHLVKTAKTLLIAVNDGSNEAMTEGKTSTCIQRLGDYLKSSGY